MLEEQWPIAVLSITAALLPTLVTWPSNTGRKSTLTKKPVIMLIFAASTSQVWQFPEEKCR